MNFGNEETNDVEETKQRMLSLDYSNTSASLASNVWLHHSASAGHIPPCNNNNNIEAMSIENSIPLNTSPLSTSSNGNANEIRSSNDGDAEGVWSPDIDQAFHEALQIYPPCGRRKIILSDEGKMYGRNELIARYIKIRCGKSRTRKQVSSHIQVLARKKQREEQARSHRDHNSLTEPNTNSSTISNNPIAASVSATIFPPTSSKNSLQKQQKIKSESEELMDGGHLLNNNNNITTSSSTNQIQNVSLAINASQQPLANLITSINRDQIASVQAQVARAASAISHNSVNWPSLIVTNNNNNQHLMTGAQLYMTSPNPCSSNVVASIPFISSNGNNYQFNSEASSSSSSEQIIFTTTPSSAFTCATTTTINKLTTISSSSFVLNEFTAYIEEQDLIKMEENNNNNRQQGRIELVHIPKTSGAPLERISLELIQSKYPPILQKLFKEGPKDAFFLAKCWANMNFEINDEQNALFAVDSYYESTAGKYDIIVSTKVCSFGNEVVEKVEIYSPINENEEDNDDIGILTKPKIWHFRLEKSPMCEYMVRFISELKRLQEPSLMNSVLENFTVLQIVSNKQSEETLMVIAFIFEVREDGEDEIYTNIYRLTE